MTINSNIMWRIHNVCVKWGELSFNKSDPFAYARKKNELRMLFNGDYEEAVQELHDFEKEVEVKLNIERKARETHTNKDAA